MHDLQLAGAVTAGLCLGGAVMAGGGWNPTPEFGHWLSASALRDRSLFSPARWRSVLADSIEQAGWRMGPGLMALLAFGGAVLLAIGGFSIGLAFGVFGFVAGLLAWLLALASSAERRRRRLAGELVPLLELFTLELSGGGSALSALGSVSMQVEGELAADLRRMLIASQVAGSATFEARLIEYSDRVRITALSSLATILAASREYGTGASQGVRALAADLRRAQRRELIARSRKALNHVLLPAAFGVLLPFLGILLFPAISVLQRSLR